MAEAALAESSYGATASTSTPLSRATLAPQICEKKQRECFSRGIVGWDGPVLLLAWLLFALPLVSCVMVNIVLGIFAFIYALLVSVRCRNLSENAGWRGFSNICFMGSVVGFALGIFIPSIFPSWRDPHDDTMALPSLAAAFICVGVAALSLVATIVASWISAWMGYKLIGSSVDFSSNEMARYICFSYDRGEDDEYPEKVSRDLMNKRLCWSGEAMYDYVHHISNEHLFLGVVFSHPAHPFEKFERIFVLVTICFLLVFPVAAATLIIRSTAIRTILVVILITGPRNLLKIYLKKITIDPDAANMCVTFRAKVLRALSRHEDSLTKYPTLTRRRAWKDAEKMLKKKEAWNWEMMFFCSVTVLVIVVCYFASRVILAHPERNFTVTLLENTIGIGFAFVLELLFDQLLPFPMKSQLGFFGQWLEERRQRGKEPTRSLDGEAKDRWTLAES